MTICSKQHSNALICLTRPFAHFHRILIRRKMDLLLFEKQHLSALFLLADSLKRHLHRYPHKNHRLDSEQVMNRTRKFKWQKRSLSLILHCQVFRLKIAWFVDPLFYWLVWFREQGVPRAKKPLVYIRGHLRRLDYVWLVSALWKIWISGSIEAIISKLFRSLSNKGAWKDR